MVDLRLIVVPPARKERGEGELGKDDEARALCVRFAHERDEALDHGFARVGEVNRPELGSGNLHVS